MNSVVREIGVVSSLASLLKARLALQPVSKTDVINTDRCPWKVWNHYTNGVSYYDMLLPRFQLKLDKGEDFDQQVDRELITSGWKSESLPFRTQSPVVGRDLRDWRQVDSSRNLWIKPKVPGNREKALVGSPDAIYINGGELIPQETKNKTTVNTRDKIELVHYYQQLEPLRTKEPESPCGVVHLQDGRYEVLSLTPTMFHRHSELVDQARKAMKKEPLVTLRPECTSCIYKEDHLRLVLGGEDLSIIGGERLQSVLRGEGIDTLADLEIADPSELHWSIRRKTYGQGFYSWVPSPEAISKFQKKAVSFLKGTPAVLDWDIPPPDSDYILLNVQYDPKRYGTERFSEEDETGIGASFERYYRRALEEGRVYQSDSDEMARLERDSMESWEVDEGERVLISAGVRVFKKGQTSQSYFHTNPDGLDSQEESLRMLFQVLETYPNFPIFGWRVSTRFLWELAVRYRLEPKFLPYYKDLYSLTNRSLYFPLPRPLALGLDEVATYLDFEARNPEFGSRDVPMVYSYLFEGVSERNQKEILKLIQEHTEDKIESLGLVYQEVVRLLKEARDG